MPQVARRRSKTAERLPATRSRIEAALFLQVSPARALYSRTPRSLFLLGRCLLFDCEVQCFSTCVRLLCGRCWPFALRFLLVVCYVVVAACCLLCCFCRRRRRRSCRCLLSSMLFLSSLLLLLLSLLLLSSLLLLLLLSLLKLFKPFPEGDRGERASASTQNAPHGLKSTPGKTLPMAFKSAPRSPGMPWIARVALLKPSGAIRGDAECQGSPGKAMGSDSGRC